MDCDDTGRKTVKKLQLSEINIRDPFLLRDGDLWYLYGTRAQTCWGPADGFDVFVSCDLKTWDPAREIFHRPEGFWADRSFWAPECIRRNDSYYLLATFGNERQKAVQILRSQRPDGPFVPVSDQPVTPKDWNCIDATYYEEEGTPYLVFSHSLPEEKRGAFCAMPLSEDLTHAEGDPEDLFFAADVPWSVPLPFAEEEMHLTGDVFLSDGPYLFHSKDKRLGMLFSSWSERGYAMGIAWSDTGRLKGPWTAEEDPIRQGGGHGMIAETEEGRRFLVLHSPNDKGSEHPVLERFDR